MARSTRNTARELFAVALGQGGYFTTKQALKAGYGCPHLDYHVSTGTFERVDHGLYRQTTIPPSDHDDLIRWTLWSRNRKDQPQAVVSHETALTIHGLGELLPGRRHFTVPPAFRKPAPAGCVLYKAELGEKDSEESVGFRVTTCGLARKNSTPVSAAALARTESTSPPPFAVATCAA